MVFLLVLGLGSNVGIRGKLKSGKGKELHLMMIDRHVARGVSMHLDLLDQRKSRAHDGVLRWGFAVADLYALSGHEGSDFTE